MESIDFKQRTTIIGANQPQYSPLYAHVDKEDPARTAYVRMKLSPDEIAEIVKTGEIWIGQLTFGNPYAPLKCCTLNPFMVLVHGADGNDYYIEPAHPVAWWAIHDWLIGKGFKLLVNGEFISDHKTFAGFDLATVNKFKSILDFQLFFAPVFEELGID